MIETAIKEKAEHERERAKLMGERNNNNDNNDNNNNNNKKKTKKKTKCEPYSAPGRGEGESTGGAKVRSAGESAGDIGTGRGETRIAAAFSSLPARSVLSLPPRPKRHGANNLSVSKLILDCIDLS